eukprot:4828357-Heterocapsa_arctica.AAC.1
MLRHTTVDATALRRLAGKISWAAGICSVLWAHVACMWAAWSEVARATLASGTHGTSEGLATPRRPVEG